MAVCLVTGSLKPKHRGSTTLYDDKSLQLHPSIYNEDIKGSITFQIIYVTTGWMDVPFDVVVVSDFRFGKSRKVFKDLPKLIVT